jgi:hypothetical protein
MLIELLFVTLAANNTNPSTCPVRAAQQLVLRARWMNQPDHYLSVFTGTTEVINYI